MWTKNGSPLMISDDSMTVDTDNGTLIIMSPGLNDVGLYQCFASTAFGIVAGLTIELQQACKSVLFT